MEVKKTSRASLEDKRVSFFLLGLIVALSFLFVALQYASNPHDLGEDESLLEDLAQDLELSMPADQKDMVSAEAVAKAPASKAVTQQVKAAEMAEKTPQKMSTTTSELVIGDGEGEVKGSEVKEANTPVPVDSDGSQAPIDFKVVQKIPEFPGGWSAFMQWLTGNLKYPPQAQRQKVQGCVVVSFIVNKDGSVADIKLSRSVHPLLDREALRVVKMMPKWKPGMDNNKVCRTMIAVPIVFKL